MGSVPGERRAMLRQGELQQALLRQNGKASEIICNIVCRSLEIYKIQKVGHVQRTCLIIILLFFNTLKFNSVNMLATEAAIALMVQQSNGASVSLLAFTHPAIKLPHFSLILCFSLTV